MLIDMELLILGLAFWVIIRGMPGVKFCSFKAAAILVVLLLAASLAVGSASLELQADCEFLSVWCLFALAILSRHQVLADDLYLPLPGLKLVRPRAPPVS
jgi:hypothetical protein